MKKSALVARGERGRSNLGGVAEDCPLLVTFAGQRADTRPIIAFDYSKCFQHMIFGATKNIPYIISR